MTMVGPGVVPITGHVISQDRATLRLPPVVGASKSPFLASPRLILEVYGLYPVIRGDRFQVPTP
jgi:hypothetical protein